MPTLAEIIDNKKDFPDDRKITLADGVETTLGELRGGYMKERDYRQKTAEVAREREAFAAEKSRFEADKTEAEAKLNDLIQQVVTRGAPKEQQKAEWEQYLERDPVSRHLMEQLQATNAAIAELKKDYGARNEEFKTALKNQQDAFIVDQHRRALATLKAKDPELNETELIQYCKDNSIPRLDLGYRLFTEDKRMTSEVSKAKETAAKEGYEKAKRELAQPMLPQRRIAEPLGKEQPTNFEEAANAALRDPEILATMEGRT